MEKICAENNEQFPVTTDAEDEYFEWMMYFEQNKLAIPVTKYMPVEISNYDIIREYSFIDENQNCMFTNLDTHL